MIKPQLNLASLQGDMRSIKEKQARSLFKHYLHKIENECGLYLTLAQFTNKKPKQRLRWDNFLLFRW